MGEATAGADVSTALRRRLRDDEDLLWHYRPPRGLYLRQRVVSTVLVGLIVVTVFYGMFALPVVLEFGARIESTLGLSVPVAVALGWAVVQVVWFVAVMHSNDSAHGRIEFAATDRRAIQLGGAAGLDTSAVDWADVQDIEMDTNVLTHLFGTGVVVVRTAGGGVSFRDVEDPTGVVERLEAIRRGEYDGPSIPVGRSATPDAVASSQAVDAGDLPAHARHVLGDDEDVVWYGTPALGAFVVPHLVLGAAAVAAAAAILTFFPAWTFYALVGVVGIERAGRRVLRYRNAEFVATTERVVQFDGAIGRDYSSVRWEDVQDVEVATGPLDGVFGTGTLRFSRAGRASSMERQAQGEDDGSAFAGVQFRDVPDPHAVADRLEDARAAGDGGG